MPITADDLENEFQEELARKSKHEQRSKINIAESVPKRCWLLLAVGMTCVVVMFTVPAPFFSHAEFPVLEQTRPTVLAHAEKKKTHGKMNALGEINDGPISKNTQEGLNLPIPSCASYSSAAAQGAHRSMTQPFVEYLYTHVKDEFFGYVSALDGPFLKAVHKTMGHSFKSFVDVGAGDYGVPDTSLAISIALLWGCDKGARIYAFEADQGMYEITRGLENAKRFPCLKWFHRAASSKAGNVTFVVSSNSGSVENSPWGRDATHQGPRITVQAMTLAEFAKEQGEAGFDFVKIDTEGHDFDIVLGMEELIRKRKVRMVMIEISEKMNEDSLAIAYHGKAPLKDIRQMTPPTLLTIVQYFDKLGYDGFFIGSKNLIPLSCDWWRDEYEITNTESQKMFGSPWVWADVVFLDRKDHKLDELRSMAKV